MYIKMRERVFNIIESGLSVTFGLLLFALIVWIYVKYILASPNNNIKDDKDDNINSDETIDDINDGFEDV